MDEKVAKLRNMGFDEVSIYINNFFDKFVML